MTNNPSAAKSRKGSLTAKIRRAPWEERSFSVRTLTATRSNSNRRDSFFV